MAAVSVSATDLVASCVAMLGFSSDAADMETPEVLAAAIRRAASCMCPTSPRLLALAVDECCRGLIDDPGSLDEPLIESIRDLIEGLVAHGDLVEVPIEDDSGVIRRGLFLAAPSFVLVSPTRALLLGVRGEGLELLDAALLARVESETYVRHLDVARSEDARELLTSAGLAELDVAEWLQHPPSTTAEGLVAMYGDRLGAAGPSGTIEGCTILDPASPPSYYRGRWRPPASRDSGRFVARRPVEFGADLWCYAELARGEVEKILDLPIHHSLARGCDEAWRLQSAIDFINGTPQRLRIAEGAPGRDPLLLLNTPLPSWAQRLLDTQGRPVGRTKGSLFTFSIPTSQIPSIQEFLSDMVWIEPEEETS